MAMAGPWLLAAHRGRAGGELPPGRRGGKRGAGAGSLGWKREEWREGKSGGAGGPGGRKPSRDMGGLVRRELKSLKHQEEMKSQLGRLWQQEQGERPEDQCRKE